MIRSLIGFALIAAVTLTSHLWTAILLEHPAVLAFVLSDRFWPAVLGGVLAAVLLGAAALSALAFHPDTLSGRRPEAGE